MELNVSAGTGMSTGSCDNHGQHGSKLEENEGIIGWNYEACVIYYDINGAWYIVAGWPIQGMEAQTDKVLVYIGLSDVLELEFKHG